MAMARDGLLPAYFARIHPRFRTPHVTTIWTGIVVGGVAMFTDIGSLSDLTNIGTLFAFALVCIGVMIFRRKDPLRPRPFRVPLVPLFPILGVIFCGVLMLSLPLETVGSFLYLVGPRPAYLFLLRRAQQQARARYRCRRNRKYFFRRSSRSWGAPISRS